MHQISMKTARRLAIAAQQLVGPYPEATSQTLLETLRQIRCLQMDPIRAVERTQYLVLWSRLGQYDPSLFHDLVYQEKMLFEYWAHAASFVLTEDYPLHEYMMRHYGQSGSGWSRRVAAWATENSEFRAYILDEIQQRGPLLTGEFEDQSKVPWDSGGWSSGRSVAYMLDYLWTSGQIMVARREGLKRWWDLSERVLDETIRQGGWDAEQVTRDAAQKSLRALGIGTQRDMERHFIEKRYPNLKDVLPMLIQEGAVQQIEVEKSEQKWLIHEDTLPLLEAIESGQWKPRTTLLSPFDNLIRDRDRTELMWDFYYRIEIYVPKAKRQYGYYVLPILHGDQLIGRIDPNMDRKKGILTINAVYVEPTTRMSQTTGKAVAQAIKRLGKFLGAKEIVYGDNLPVAWRDVLTKSV